MTQFNNFIRPLGYTNNDTRESQASLNQALSAVETQGQAEQTAFVSISRTWLDQQMDELRRQGLHHFVSKTNQAAQVGRIKHLKQLERYLSILSATTTNANHSVDLIVQQRITAIQKRMNIFLGLAGVGLPFLLTFGSTALSLALIQAGQLLTPVNLAFGGIASSGSAAIIGLISAVVIAGIVVGIIYGFQKPKRERLALLNAIEEHTITPEELNDAYLAACKNNDTVVLHYLEDTYKKRITDKTITNAYLTALHDEHKEMLSYLKEKWPNKTSAAILSVGPAIYADFARSGNISMMTYIEETFPSIVPFLLELNDSALFSIALRECTPEVITHVDSLINEHYDDPGSFKIKSLRRGKYEYEPYETAFSRENPSIPEDKLREYTKLVIKDYEQRSGEEYDFEGITYILIKNYYLPAIIQNNERILTHIEACYGQKRLLDRIVFIDETHAFFLALKRYIAVFGETDLEKETFSNKVSLQTLLKESQETNIHGFEYQLPITPAVLSRLEEVFKTKSHVNFNTLFSRLNSDDPDNLTTTALARTRTGEKIFPIASESIQILKRLIIEHASTQNDTNELLAFPRAINRILHQAVKETDELVTTFHKHFPKQFNELFLSGGYDFRYFRTIPGAIKPIHAQGLIGNATDRPIVSLYKIAIRAENISLMRFIEEKVEEVGHNKSFLRSYADARSYAQTHKAPKALMHILCYTARASLDDKIELYSYAIKANDKDVKDQLERDNLFHAVNTFERNRPTSPIHSSKLIQAAIIADDLDAFTCLMSKLDKADEAATYPETTRCLISSGASRVLQHYMQSDLFNRACRANIAGPNSRGYASYINIEEIITNSLRDSFSPLSKNPDAIYWLLNNAELYYHAALHSSHHNVNSSVNTFTDQKIKELRCRQAMWTPSTDVPHFNIPIEEAFLCFRMIEHLIKLNKPEDIERIRFLAEIPAVNSLLHQTLNSEAYSTHISYADNSLLLLAMRVGNTQASALLLENPHVLRLAERENYYAREENNRVDLAAILANPESSMQSFSVDENKLLTQIREHYATKINRKTDTLIQALQQAMVDEYTKDPAFYTDKQTKRTLPLSWENFNALGLARESREKALIAYHTHAAHSGYRFLLDPNPFMASNAHWVVRNADGSRTASYNSSRSLLAILYLLMADDSYDTEDTTDNSPTIRRNMVADCLYELVRAHNKEDRNRSGKIVHYRKEGDKPSCSMGMPRRLFYCLNRLGEAMKHPVFMKETSALKIKTECDEFLRQHIKAYFEAHDTEGDVSNALNLFLNGDEEDEYDLHELPAKDESLLRNSNVSHTEVEMFIRTLAQKHGSTFTLPKQTAVRNYFELNDSLDELHITKHWDDSKVDTWYKPSTGGGAKPM